MKNESIAEVYAMSVADNMHKPYTPNWYVVFDRAFKEKMAELEPKPKPVTYTEQEAFELVNKYRLNYYRYLIGHMDNEDFSPEKIFYKWLEENKKQG